MEYILTRETNQIYNLKRILNSQKFPLPTCPPPPNPFCYRLPSSHVQQSGAAHCFCHGSCKVLAEYCLGGNPLRTWTTHPAPLWCASARRHGLELEPHMASAHLEHHLLYGTICKSSNCISFEEKPLRKKNKTLKFDIMLQDKLHSNKFNGMVSYSISCTLFSPSWREMAKDGR